MNPLSLTSTIACAGLILSGGVMNRKMLALFIGVLLVITLIAAFLSLLAVFHQKEGIMLIGTSLHTLA